MKVENWSRKSDEVEESHGLIAAWESDNTPYEIAVDKAPEDEYRVVIMDTSMDDVQVRQFFIPKRQQAMRWARTYIKRHPDPTIEDSYEMEKATLSDEGRRLLDEQGYMEVHIPIFYEDDEDYCHLTVDFVSDEAPEIPQDVSNDEYDKLLRRRQRWVAENLFDLVTEGKVMMADDEDKINSVEDLVAFQDEFDEVAGVR